MATVIDTLFLELGIDSGKFGTQAKEAENRLDRMSASFGRAEKSAAKSSKGLEKQAEQSVKSTKQAKSLTQAVGSLAKGFAAFTALVMGSNALGKLIREGAQANVELDNLSRNIGISRNQLQAWGGMAEMAGGSAEGMKGSLAGLSMGITRLTTMGDTSMVPFFNAFGVALLNADGKARDLDSIMLDLADRFAKMDRVQAYNLAKSMGLDDGTINTLMLGRAEMEKMLEMQRNLYRSGEKEIAVSRELTQARGYLNAQWDSLKAMLADALAPVLLKIVKMVSGFVDYLMKHENSMKHVFEGLAFVLGAVLIPVFIAATASLLAFIAPFAPFILTVGALGAAFLLLYDDYKTWAEGGKSLLDWKLFDNYIKTSKISTDSLGSAFVYLLTGYTSWADAANGLLDWLKLKGFIDENGLSIKSLKEGFHNLYLEIKNYLMPYFEALSDTFTAMMNGDWEGMKKGMGRMVKEAGNVVTDVVGWGVGHAAGVIDTATGHDPNADGSLQSQAKNATNAAKQMIGSTAGVAMQASKQTTDAAKYAMEHALPASANKCALYVNNSLRAQGIKVNGHGKDVAGNLIRSGQGFQEVKYGADYVPQDGDVMSIDHGRHGYGHVAIYNARLGKWVSDFVQNKTRGNTAAANDQDYQSILNGKAKVTIARKNGGGNPSALAVNYGDHQKIGGSKAWRNNNEGNLRYGKHAKKYGAIGQDKDGFAIFRTEEDGRRAKAKLLFKGDNYKNLNLMQAIARYAPPNENNTALYQKTILSAVGGKNKRMMDFSSAEQEAIMQAMRKIEGWKVGQIKHLNDIAAGAQRGMQSMRQGEAVRAQNVTNNNQRTTQVSINGGIHVQSSASTITGTMDDASAAARDRMVQIVPAMV